MSEKEIVVRNVVKREPGWFYFLDKEGNVGRMKPSKGRVKVAPKIIEEFEDEEPEEQIKHEEPKADPMEGLSSFQRKRLGIK